ncbi:ATP-binding protein [Modestobacter sp. NPDC049651]|uniref:ATP-binding protein n=1 Tax=unclassified Modestobacter TaxID=2643866 RepID=UPI0033C8160E
MQISLSVVLPGEPGSVPVARALVRQACEQLGVEQAVAERVTLAVGELAANAVRHTGSPSFEVRAELDGRSGRFTVLDDGPGLPEEVPTPGHDGGHGLTIVRALADTLDAGRGPDGRHRVRITMPLTARETLPR